MNSLTAQAGNRAAWAKNAALGMAAIACLTPILRFAPKATAYLPALAMIAGAAIGIAWNTPLPKRLRGVSRVLMQGSVVLLGFSIDLGDIVRAGSRGIVFSVISISAVFTLGLLLQRLLKVRPMTGLLISAGTAICGGSAIAAVSTVVDSPAEDVAVSAGTVFLLNAVALLAFPPIGHALGLSQYAFGVWSGIAIHDIASVVGAGAAYGAAALATATTVKLSRVLFLVPILIVAMTAKRRASGPTAAKGSAMPWFAGLFVLASAARSLVPGIALSAEGIKDLASAGFCISLLLTGAALTRSGLKSVGAKPLLMGVLLWAFISCAALIAVHHA